jgi:hypothetical protein
LNIIGCHQRSGICTVGDFIYSSLPATAAERITKVEILLLSSIVNVKLGQKLSSEPNDERRRSSAPIEQMRCCVLDFTPLILIYELKNKRCSMGSSEKLNKSG